MIIEFLGVSGVGKTTCAKEYKRKLEEEGKEVIWDTYELYEKQGWLTRNIQKGIAIIVYYIFHSSWVREYRNYLKRNITNKHEMGKPLFNAIFLKTLLLKARKDNKIHFFDEGALQYLWAVKLRGRFTVAKEDIDEIEKLFGLPDELIVIKASTQTITSRIKQRGEYVRIMKNGNIEGSVATMSTLIEKILILCDKRIKYYIYSNEKTKQ